MLPGTQTSPTTTVKEIAQVVVFIKARFQALPEFDLRGTC